MSAVATGISRADRRVVTTSAVAVQHRLRALLAKAVRGPSLGRHISHSDPNSIRRAKPSTGLAAMVTSISMMMTGAQALAETGGPSTSAPIQLAQVKTFDTGVETIFDAEGWPLEPGPGEPVSTMPSSRQRWDCRLFDDLTGYTRDLGDLTMNNFRLRGKPGRFSNVTTAELSFTVLNRSAKNAFVTFQFTVYDRTSPLPSMAFSLEPSFGILSADSTKQMTARVNVLPGELERAARFCLRVDG